MEQIKNCKFHDRQRSGVGVIEIMYYFDDVYQYTVFM